MIRLRGNASFLGLLSGTLAALLGVAHLVMAGAPAHFPLVNLAALVVGAAVWLVTRQRVPLRWHGPAVLALALLLLATALFGVAIDGASRWVNVGPLSLQVSLLVLPAIVVLYARSSDVMGTVGVAIAAFALATQPDRAMAGALLAGVGATVLTQYSRRSSLALLAAAVAFAVAMLRPDRLPAAPFVERVLYSAFEVHIVAGLGVLLGSIVLLAPSLIIRAHEVERSVLFAFGASWAAAILAAAIGNYPTPVVGYGASSVLGYFISAGLLAAPRARSV